MLGMSHGAPSRSLMRRGIPERVRKLVLVNGFAAGLAFAPIPKKSPARVVAGTWTGAHGASAEPRSREMFIALYFPGASKRLIDWYIEHFKALGPVANMEAMIEVASIIDVRDELAKISAPTLICTCRGDGNACRRLLGAGGGRRSTGRSSSSSTATITSCLHTTRLGLGRARRCGASWRAKERALADALS